MRLIFVRHGDPDYIHDTLTEKGEREAAALAERVAQWDVKEFYCSPLGRARKTAQIAMEDRGRSPVILDWLEEFRAKIRDPETGESSIAWDFMPGYWTEQEALYDRKGWAEADIMQTGPVRQIYEETCRGLDQLLESYGYVRKGQYYQVGQGCDDTIVLFCHMGITFAMLSHLLGISMTVLLQGFFAAPTSVTILSSEEREKGTAYFRCQVLGDTSHLHRAGETISKAGYFAEVFQD